ncbi:hypothetical protein PHYNN_207 [Pantoea phage Phynn]|nr:hypothetical protein PHYNN_207 [Pantoea phage Phynn]
MQNKPVIWKDHGIWVCADKQAPSGSRTLGLADSPASAYRDWQDKERIKIQPFFINDIIFHEGMVAIVTQADPNGSLTVTDLETGKCYGLAARYCKFADRKTKPGELISIPSANTKKRGFWDWILRR